MANPAGMSVSESSVYRGIFNVLSNTSYQSGIEQFSPEDQKRFVDMSKWSFLQKLLAIEKAHDRKKLERGRRNKDRESPIHKHNKLNQTIDTSEPDLLSRWLHHQILDGSEEPLCSDSYRGSQNHLPALSKVDQPSNIYKQTRATVASQITDLSNNNDFLLQQSVVDNVNQMSSATDTMTSDMTCQIHAQDDEDVSVVKPTRKRQLRLPPILLPRLYTVTPRPLKCREFLTPTKIRGPITDEEWEELKDCRYIRRASLQMSPTSASSLQYYTNLT